MRGIETLSRVFHILVIDDEPVIRDSCMQILSRRGCEVVLASTGKEGLEKVESSKFDTVILDLKLPDIDGISLLNTLNSGATPPPVIVITAYPTVKGAVEAMKLGAYDYIPKPFTPGILRDVVSKAFHSMRHDTRAGNSDTAGGECQALDNIIGSSSAIRDLKKRIVRAGMSDCSVLITGETGTGKELVARALHASSRRRAKNFICIDSGTLVENLVESELFGHVKGAFTGAYTHRVGRFEMADEGTLFFDEISNMSHNVQGKLLRVLQEQELTRVGGSESIPVNVRLIAATNRDIGMEIRNGKFRDDLYFRLNVISLHILPLRERHNDILELSRHFLEKERQRHYKPWPESISDRGMARLMTCHWSGNVRELENVIARTYHMCDTREADPFEIEGCIEPENTSPVQNLYTPLGNVEKECIKQTLKRHDYNKTRAARELGIDRKTLRTKINKYGITDSSFQL